MDEIIRQIKEQQNINFKNIRDQILTADLNAKLDQINNSRFIFHYLHSIDRFFINPEKYEYEGEKLFEIPENLSIISESRQGFIKDMTIIVSREKLLKYLDYVQKKTDKFFETLTIEKLLQKPEGSDYTHLELILGQFRHMMWHIGLSSAITFEAKKEWNSYTGLTNLKL